jgi:hypothetical protein
LRTTIPDGSYALPNLTGMTRSENILLIIICSQAHFIHTQCLCFRVHNTTRSVSIYHRPSNLFSLHPHQLPKMISMTLTNPPWWNAPKRTRRPRIPMLPY